MAKISSDITEAKLYLDAGNIIGFPTETVYGLAANALDKKAVATIYKVKNRPSFDPLIVHCSSVAEIEKYAKTFPEELKLIATKYMPGACTVLLEKKDLIPSIVSAGLSKVAFRIPNHPKALELLNILNYPLAAPSANPFGYISPTSSLHVEKQLGTQIPFILEGGKCAIGIESTIIGLENNTIIVHRLGGLSVEEFSKNGLKVELQINQSSNPTSPGQIKSHYAPKKKFIVGNIEDLIEQFKNKKIGLLNFGKNKYNGVEIELNLSKNADTTEAAINLFDYMRTLDESDVDIIISSYVSNFGLGLAINDRLKRASTN